MPTSDQKTNIVAAITAIRNAQNLLHQQICAATDVLTAIKLKTELDNLDSSVSQLSHALNASDDATFTATTATLQSNASILKADEAAMQKIVTDVKTAATIVQYITKALGFIAKL